jgi:hypothetical protein
VCTLQGVSLGDWMRAADAGEARGLHGQSLHRVEGKGRGLGLLFPSYFSLLRTGAAFVETVVGITTRRFSGAEVHEANKIIPSVAIFGRPVVAGRVRVRCINRVHLRQVAYHLGFGPADAP